MFPSPATPLAENDARAIALDLIEAVLDRGQALDEAWERHAGLPRLAVRDRAFVRLLAATVLRRLGEIDELVARRLARPLPRHAAPVRHALRLGTAQLVFLGTPPHAAVDTTVHLTRRLGHHGLAGLVNAVLRAIARSPRTPHPDPGRVNTPKWLWRSWVAAFGEATARAIADAHLREPPLDLTVRGHPEEWAARLEAEMLPTGSLRRSAGGEPRDLPGFAEGAWWVQDAAAALPARLLGAVCGRTVIDLCAAPGGKTAQLAAAGARVVAVDRSRPRVARLRENLARLRLEAETVVADALDWRPEAPADAVLLDAPCSATGTIRRHPDVQHRKRPRDLGRLAALQDRLLRTAIGMVRPGGLLIYATCSLQPEEGPERIAALLAEGAPVRRVPITNDELPGIAEFITDEGDLRTLPSHWAARGGLDGFFVARLRRVAS